MFRALGSVWNIPKSSGTIFILFLFPPSYPANISQSLYAYPILLTPLLPRRSWDIHQIYLAWAGERVFWAVPKLEGGGAGTPGDREAPRYSQSSRPSNWKRLTEDGLEMGPLILAMFQGECKAARDSGRVNRQLAWWRILTEWKHDVQSIPGCRMSSSQSTEILLISSKEAKRSLEPI